MNERITDSFLFGAVRRLHSRVLGLRLPEFWPSPG